MKVLKVSSMFKAVGTFFRRIDTFLFSLKGVTAQTSLLFWFIISFLLRMLDQLSSITSKLHHVTTSFLDHAAQRIPQQNQQVMANQPTRATHGG